MAFDFTLNGKAVHVGDDIASTTTLLDYLRTHGKTGSKQGCAEGDCGACTVALLTRDASGKATYRAVNSCIALLPMFAGREVVSVEGLQAQGEDGKLHPVQQNMVDQFGSQCGYCTPGFTVSLFEAYYRRGCTQPWQISDQLCGNLCRCTGYRPIRDAAMGALADRAKAAGADPFAEKLSQPLPDLVPLDSVGDKERFVRPTSLSQLLDLLGKNPTARLVGGATEIGVEINKKSKPFPFLVSTEGVPELTVIRATPEAWHLGSAVTLTAIEEAIGDEYPSFQKMIRVFASRQIRNRATLGGNISTASPIGDGPPLLLALDASLILTGPSGDRSVPLSEFFTGYRKTVLAPGEIIREIVLPRTPAGTTKSDFYKVSKRRELDISIVAAAFTLHLGEDGVITKARLAFGGVAATPIRARRAEAVLEGRTLAEAAGDAASVLAEEFQPIDDVRAGAEFRRGLVVSLWKKFVTGEQSEAQDGALNFDTDRPWPISEVSKALRHESAEGHVTGKAMYIDDIAQKRPMLDIWPVMAPHARAKILRRDASAALALPGVVLVLMAEDVPGHNDIGIGHDEPLFAKDDIRYYGQVVAMVVATSLRQAKAAAALVKVEYEVMTPILGVPEAIAANSYHSPEHALKRGDCPAALAAAPERLEGEFYFGGQEHFYLETHAAWAEAGEEGTVFVSSSTQHPSEIQQVVSEATGQPRNKIVVQAPRMGGGFGGKETQGNAFACIVAIAAMKTGQPARIQLDRDVDMTLTGKRHPFYSKFTVGFDRDGLLLASRVHLVSDGGWSLDLSQPILDRALFHLDNGYYIPAVHFSGLIAKTNVTSHTAFRGFGGPQGMLVVEEIIDRIARHLGLPPEVVRDRNLYRGTGETNTTHFREEIGDNRLRTIWDKLLADSEFVSRKKTLRAWNAAHTGIKRGLAITPVKFGISFTLSHYNQAGALVHIYQDGTVQVNHGGTEMGQGLYTKILGVVMRELGLPRAAVRMMPTSTDKVPNTSATAASSGADLNGAAVQNACVILRERIVPVAAKVLGKKTGAAVSVDSVRFADGFVRSTDFRDCAVSFAEVVLQAYFDRVSLSTTGFYQTPGVKWDWATTTGRPFHYFACGAAVAEVEVDGYSGMHRVLRVDILHDVGDSLNPGIDRGQIEGAFVQGMGWLTREELLWDKKGRLLTHSASTYQIPAISDAPLEFRVHLLENAATGNTIHNSKAVGEPPFMLAFCVREAIRDAVSQFGGAGGQVPLASPATAEAIFKAIRLRPSGPAPSAAEPLCSEQSPAGGLSRNPVLRDRKTD